MTPAGFPHSDIHGSKPACGSPWLFAAYHVFLRRPVPWHPPCALSNLIVTNLSSCQRIAFAIFDSFFLLRPTAKLFAFYCASCVISNTFATGFFTRCFSIWLCSFQSTFSGHHASRAGFRRGFFKSFAPSGSLSLAATDEIDFSFSSSGYLDVSVPRVPFS